MEHSKLPWGVFNQTDIFPLEHDYGQNRYIADCSPLGYSDNPGASLLTTAEMDANAEFIVKACNEHDGLVAKAAKYDEIKLPGAAKEFASRYKEHGDLKAKAELFGELVTMLGQCQTGLHYYLDNFAQDAIDREATKANIIEAEALLTKCKEVG